jgi:hypothetical protein
MYVINLCAMLTSLWSEPLYFLVQSDKSNKTLHMKTCMLLQHNLLIIYRAKYVADKNCVEELIILFAYTCKFQFLKTLLMQNYEVWVI